MPPCHGGGRGFESRPDRKKPLRKLRGFFCVFSYPFNGSWIKLKTDQAENLGWIKPNTCGAFFQALMFANLKRKNVVSLTPLEVALKALTLALKDSADALVLRLLKLLRIGR